MDAKLTPKKRTAREWRPVFISTLRNTGNVRASCQAAGVSRPVAYNARESSPEFAKEWDTALQDAIDVLEAVARKRAQESSDTLLIFLLKSHRPEVYRDLPPPPTLLQDNRTVNVLTGLTDEQLRQALLPALAAPGS